MSENSGQRTLVTFLLDKSGSMATVKDATIEGYNAYRDTLAADPLVDMTLLMFDHYRDCQIDKFCVGVPAAQAPRLDINTYTPRGGTPLVEAAIKTIEAVAVSLAERPAQPKVIICIQTDGEENQSATGYTYERLKGLITAKEALGWQFNFLGAGIDAYAAAQKFGVSMANTVAYNPSNTRETFAAAGASTMRYASGAAKTTEYTLAEKAASGDLLAKTYDPRMTGTPALPATPNLNLTVGGPNSFVLPKGPTPDPAMAVKVTSDDLVL